MTLFSKPSIANAIGGFCYVRIEWRHAKKQAKGKFYKKWKYMDFMQEYGTKRPYELEMAEKRIEKRKNNFLP